MPSSPVGKPLDGSIENVVFTADADLEVVTLGKPTAYGHHLYFQIVAYIPAEEEITDDNFLEYLYYKEDHPHLPCLAKRCAHL